jgi:plastocyanin
MHTAHPFRRAFIGLGVVAAMFAAFLGTTAAHAASAPRTWHAVVGAENGNHAIQGMVFLPRDIYINVGDTIRWTAKGGDIHTVTFLAPG